jgi:hypothetical protein
LFVDRIDYPSFVVECVGNSSDPVASAETLLATLNNLLENETELLQQKQAAMKIASRQLVYGVGPDAHKTNDAFTHLIRSLREYVDNR